jgi:hypothetical protein
LVRESTVFIADREAPSLDAQAKEPEFLLEYLIDSTVSAYIIMKMCEKNLKANKKTIELKS